MACLAQKRQIKKHINVNALLINKWSSGSPAPRIIVGGRHAIVIHSILKNGLEPSLKKANVFAREQDNARDGNRDVLWT